MSSKKPENYLDTVPDDVDKTQEEWEQLGYDGQYYHANNRREEQRIHKQKRREEKRRWLQEYKKTQSCTNCGESEPVCLDFHHIGEKKYNIGNMVGMDLSIDTIQSELEKCITLCANCHRKQQNGLIDVDQNI